MRAAQIDQYNQPLVINNVSDPSCPDDGVVIKVQASGVCRSDWHGWKGTHPLVKPGHIPGHEFAGIICEVGNDCHNFSVGDRVTAPFIVACGKCHDCAHTSATVCDTQHLIGFSTKGSFAQFVPVTRADFNLVRLPDTISFVDAAGMGCRVTTAYRALFDRAKLQPGEWLAIHGCGGVGLSAILLAKSMGARIIAIDINPEALAQAKNIGADHLLNPTDHDNVGETIREISSGGAQVSLDALGITPTFINSISGLAKLGRHIQVGYPLGPHATPTLPLHDLVYKRQISIIGTRGMAASEFPALFDLLQKKEISPGRLVSKTIGLEDISEAFFDMDTNRNAGISVVDRF